MKASTRKRNIAENMTHRERPASAQGYQNKAHVRLSRDSSRIISSSRDPSPLAHVSTHVSHISSCSMNDHGRVQSRIMRTSACGREVRGGRNCGRRDRCEGEEDGTVYTERRARVSVPSGQLTCKLQWKRHGLPSSASSLTSAQS